MNPADIFHTDSRYRRGFLLVNFPRFPLIHLRCYIRVISPGRPASSWWN